MKSHSRVKRGSTARSSSSSRRSSTTSKAMRPSSSTSRWRTSPAMASSWLINTTASGSAWTRSARRRFSRICGRAATPRGRAGAEEYLREGNEIMRILLTGHDGYIGHVLTPMLLDRGHEVTGLDSCLYEGCGVATGFVLVVLVFRFVVCVVVFVVLC